MNDTLKCIQCSKEFTPKRKTAKFCSDSCRRDYNRSKPPTPKEISPPKPKQESQKNKSNKVSSNEVLNHPIKRPPKPDYMTDYDYSRWDGVECKFGACLNRKCPYRVRT